jgi:hypothetical protein
MAAHCATAKPHVKEGKWVVAWAVFEKARGTERAFRNRDDLGRPMMIAPLIVHLKNG